MRRVGRHSVSPETLAHTFTRLSPEEEIRILSSFSLSSFLVYLRRAGANLGQVGKLGVKK